MGNISGGYAANGVINDLLIDNKVWTDWQVSQDYITLNPSGTWSATVIGNNLTASGNLVVNPLFLLHNDVNASGWAKTVPGGSTILPNSYGGVYGGYSISGYFNSNSIVTSVITSTDYIPIPENWSVANSPPL